MTTESAGL